MVFIYSLSDSKGIRYVGKTINLKLRERKHINESKSGKFNNHRINWIKSLLINNERPVMEILDIVDDDEWAFWEIYWISQIKSWGFNLVNGTNGGENPPSWKGKTHSEEYKEIRRKIMSSDKNPSKNMTDDWRKNISKSNKGRKFTEEHLSHLGKIINQFDLNGNFIKEWASITQASKELNICHNSISLCVRGKRKTGGNFIWKFK